MPFATLPLSFGALLAASSPPASVATLDQLGPALTACFTPPDGSAGSAVTVRFSLDRRGAVIGRPAVTYARLVGKPAQKRAFVAAALDALARCTPVPVTPGLGGAIAGRPLSVRFVGGGPTQAI